MRASFGEIRGVKYASFFFCLFSICSFVGAEEFKVESVINEIVADLPDPVMRKFFGAGHMAISTSSDEAAIRVAQGMTCLNTSWDFEAYRNFCAAAKADPDCLMAYWGITMSLAGSQHEFFEERQNAINRMLDLLEWEKTQEVKKWTKLERVYCQAAGVLMTDGARKAGESFLKISEAFPLDVQSRLFSHFLLRDGFDEFGKPRIGQVKSSEGLFTILGEYPENLSVMAFWVTSQSEGALNGNGLRKDVLPVARKLVRLHPNYAPFQLVLAHVEARCGNAALAIQAANYAALLYEKYQKEQGVSVFDCEGWVRAKVYMVNLYETKGNTAEAMKIAQELAMVPITKERIFSRGAVMLLWEGRTAGARVMLASSDRKELDAGQKSLEVLKEDQWFKDESFAIYYRDCLAFSLAVRSAVSVGDLKSAKSLNQQFAERVLAFERHREIAKQTSSYGSWLRARSALGVMIVELKGLIAELDPEPVIRSTALNWYRGAIERQFRPANLLPPAIDYPMENRLGQFYINSGQFAKAALTFREALNVRPNHIASLMGYRDSLLKLGKTDTAKSISERIEAVKR